MILADEGVAVLVDRFRYGHLSTKVEGYFHQTLAPEDIESGRTIAWPKSGLKDELWKIRNMEDIHRPTFPTQWRQKDTARAAHGRNGGIGGGEDAMWFPHMGMGHHTGNMTPYHGMIQQHLRGQNPYGGWQQQGQQFGNGAGHLPGQYQHGGGREDQGNCKIDDGELTRQLAHMHHTIRKCMHQYHQKFRGRVMLTNILSAANTDISALPSLNACMKNGKSNLCYLNVLGHCGRGDQCIFGHPQATFPDKFPEGVCRVVSAGLDYVIRNESETPPRPRKRDRGG